MLPTVTFSGRLFLVDSPSDVVKATAYLSKFSRIGLDTETRPAFKKGVVHRVALLQLSTEDTTFLIRLNRVGMTPELVALMENPHIEKIGLALRDDIKSLQKLTPFEPRAVVEIQTMAKQRKFKDESLQKLYALLYDERISKSQRVTNWEADVLSEQQKVYAAIDAWACLRIYEKLLTLPMATESRKINL